MNFDDSLKHHLPAVWFCFKFFKYKYLGRGERELALIRHLVEPGSTALDIGSSIGMYAAEMARYAGKVIAFEANPDVAAFTARVVPRNVEVVNVALSSVQGEATLRMPRGRRDSVTELATIEADNRFDGVVDSVNVAMKRLDDFAIADCSFVKIDVEGHEQAVLDGASALIAAQRPILMIELDEGISPGTMRRVASCFARESYGGYFLSNGALHAVAEFDAAKHQDQTLLRYTRKTLPAGREYINNVLFVPEEKTARILARV